jgi:hypothetical protein
VLIEQSVDLTYYAGACDPQLPGIERERDREAARYAALESNVGRNLILPNESYILE